jgi:AcrR family transcriptional regulator
MTRAESQEQTRQHLLDAAEALFRAQGLHRTTVGQIAEEAGYTPGAVYSNYANKEELALAVLGRDLTLAFDALSATLAANDDFTDRLVAVVRWRRRMLVENQPLGVLRLELAIAARHDDVLLAHLASAQRQVREAFTTLLRQQAADLGGRFTSDPELLATTVISVADGTAIGSAIEPDGPHAAAFAWMLATLTRSIEPSPLADDEWDDLVVRLVAVARSGRDPGPGRARRAR